MKLATVLSSLACLMVLHPPAFAQDPPEEQKTEQEVVAPPAASPTDASEGAQTDQPPPTPTVERPPAELPPVPPSAEDKQDVLEKPSAVSGGLTVVGQRRRREKRPAAHTLGEAQLERFNRDDPHAVMNQVPGVYTRQEDGLGLRPNIGARGVNPDRSKKITLMEDDVLFGPAPYSAPAAYFFPLITRMVEVEMLKGAANLAHGPQTVAGALNLRTRQIPVGWAAGMDLAGGQYVYGKGHGYVGGGWKHFGFLIEGVHLRTDGFKELDGGGDTGFTRNEWMLKTQYVLNPDAAIKHTFKLKLGYSNEDSNETYLGLSAEDFKRNPLRRYAASQLDSMQWDRTQVELRHEVHSQNLDVVTTAYRIDLSRVWRKVNGFGDGVSIHQVLRDPTGINRGYYDALVGNATGIRSQTIMIGPNDRDFVSQGVQTRGRWRQTPWGLRNELDFEARLHNDSARFLHTQDAFVFEDSVLKREPGTATQTTANDNTRSTAVSLYAGDELELGALTVKPAARVEIIATQLRDRRSSARLDNTTVAFLPGFNAHYQLWKGLGALAGVHRGFSPASPRDPIAQTERSTNFEGGLRYDERRLRLEAIGFWNEYQNLTAICSESSGGCGDGDVGQQVNAGAARIRGLEAMAQTEYKHGLTALPLLLTYTFTDAKFLSSFDSSDPIFGRVQEGDEIPYVPSHQLSLTAGVERPLWGLGASALHVSRMRDTPGQEALSEVTTTDSLTLIDATAHLNLPRNVQLYLHVRNLFDETAKVSYRPFGARPNAPRWIQLGGRWSF